VIIRASFLSEHFLIACFTTLLGEPRLNPEDGKKERKKGKPERRKEERKKRRKEKGKQTTLVERSC